MCSGPGPSGRGGTSLWEAAERERNTLTVTCRTGDRNMMGPFHYFDCDNEYTGPGTFAGIRGWEDNFNVKTPFLLIPEQTFTEGKNLIEERMGEMIEIKLVRRT